MSLATQSLKINSIEAAQLWRDLQNTIEPSEIEELLEAIWQAQTNQELATDIMADVSDQIEAEIIAIKARMNHLVSIHQAAINKLESWRLSLDKTIINLNEQGIINSEIIGQQRRITIKDNPPTCEVTVDPSQLPEEYQRVKTVINPDKKAIITAWKRGIPVEGTHVYRHRKVVYELLKNSNFQSLKSQLQ